MFLYIDDKHKNLVIDGQQRILSVVYFMEGYFGKESTHGKRQVFRLTGLSDKSAYHRKRFIDLSEDQQRKLKQSVLRAINIRQLSPTGESTSAYHIFERLNTGGTPLKPQEIRNCVFMGPLSQMLKDANLTSDWRSLLGKKTIDRHQKDTELILRVFALTAAEKDYEKPMKEFLNKAMRHHQDGTTAKVRRFFSTFPKAVALLVQHLGEKPFHLRGRLNVSALDSVLAITIETFCRDFQEESRRTIQFSS